MLAVGPSTFSACVDVRKDGGIPGLLDPRSSDRRQNPQILGFPWDSDSSALVLPSHF
jgi:hypothetical protein